MLLQAARTVPFNMQSFEKMPCRVRASRLERWSSPSLDPPRVELKPARFHYTDGIFRYPGSVIKPGDVTKKSVYAFKSFKYTDETSSLFP